LLAAPLAGIMTLGDLASADSGSAIANSPYNAGDGKLDSTPAGTITTVPDHAGNQEEGYSSGAKEDDPCPTITLHSSSPKDDITSFSVGTQHVAGINPGDFLYLGWTRVTNQGSTTIEFELNQNQTSCGSDPTRNNRVRTTD